MRRMETDELQRDDEEVAEGCAQMCLIDKELKNVEAEEVVDKLIQEWRNVDVEGVLCEKVFCPILFTKHYSMLITKANKAFDVFVAL